MVNKSIYILSISLLIVFITSFNLQKEIAWESKYVAINKNGTLRYTVDSLGNIIPDFSRVGYHQGDKAIPDVPVKKIVNPAATGSSQEIIQKAIDELAAIQPDKNGFRGVYMYYIAL